VNGMGQKTTVFCDICQSDKRVAPIVVVREYGKRDPWEADMCESCYIERFGDIKKKARRPMTSNVRPQHRFHKVEITEANL